jgi:hypothetical protein
MKKLCNWEREKFNPFISLLDFFKINIKELLGCHQFCRSKNGLPQEIKIFYKKEQIFINNKIENVKSAKSLDL